MRTGSISLESGPFYADQIRPGDRYELSDGHPVYCQPTGGRGSRATLVGGAALQSDPAVTSVGTDTGFTPSPKILRAPDLAIGAIPDEPGWVAGVPLLAVEYADTGQDEADLAQKIRELLAAGTRYVWVVRLTGPRRVEIHTPDTSMRLANPGDELTAPGILKNPVPVEALYDQQVSEGVVLRNLLERQGYTGLDAVREEGRIEGKEEGREEGALAGLRDAVRTLLAARGLKISADSETTLSACTDPATLKGWLEKAMTAESADTIFS